MPEKGYQISDIRYQEAVGCWGNSDQRPGIEEVHHRGHREHRDKEERRREEEKKRRREEEKKRRREEEKSSLQREQRAAEDTEKRKANPRAERFLTPQTPFGMTGVCVLLRGKPKNPRAKAARGAPGEEIPSRQLAITEKTRKPKTKPKTHPQKTRVGHPKRKSKGKRVRPGGRRLRGRPFDRGRG